MNIKFVNNYVEHDEVYLLVEPYKFSPQDVINTAICYLDNTDATVVMNTSLGYHTLAKNRKFIYVSNVKNIKDSQLKLIKKALANPINADYLSIPEADIKAAREFVFDNIVKDPFFSFLNCFNGQYNKSICDDVDIDYAVEFSNALNATVPILRRYIISTLNSFCLKL